MKISEQQLIKGLGPLSDFEISLLTLIVEHGMIVKSTWLTLPFAEAMTSVEMARAMWRLTNRRILVAHQLFPGKMWFTTTNSTNVKLRMPVSKKPLSVSAMIRCFARLQFFTEIQPTAYKLEPAQLVRKLDGEPTYGLPPGFYGRDTDEEVLGFFRVDGHLENASTRASVTRAAQVLRHDIFRLVKFKRIQQLLKNKKFEFTWITASQWRADAVLEQFQQYNHIGKAPINALVVPELTNFSRPTLEEGKSQIHL